MQGRQFDPFKARGRSRHPGQGRILPASDRLSRRKRKRWANLLSDSSTRVSATSIPRLSSVDGGGAVRCFRTSALRALA